MFAKNFSKDSNLDYLYTSLSVAPSRTNMKLHNISITPKMVKKVITNLDSSNSSDPDCILVVILKNCEPELSYILAELFKMCLVFQIVGRFYLWSLYLRMLGKGLLPETSTLFSLFSVVSEVFEKLVNMRIIDHLQNFGLFSDFQYGFRSYWSTADLLNIVFDRIARVFNRSGYSSCSAW